jgi:hypothetical protein
VSEIKQALGRLSASLDNMEAAARHVQGRVQKLQVKGATGVPQRDLFAVAQQGAMNGTTGQVEYLTFDPTILARKLDIAIEKVEQVLREG